MGLRIPYGMNADELPSKIPDEQAFTMGQLNEPAPQPQQSPQRAPSVTKAPPAQDLGSATALAEDNPYAAALAEADNPYSQLLQDEKADPGVPVEDTGYTYITSRTRKHKPTGTVEFQVNGNFLPLDQAEVEVKKNIKKEMKELPKSVAHGVVAATGMTFGAKFVSGFTNQLVKYLGPALGSAGGGYLSEVGMTMAKIRDPEDRHDMMNAVIDAVTGAAMQGMASQAERAGAKAESNAVGAAAAEATDESANQKILRDQFKEQGVEPRANQIDPDNVHLQNEFQGSLDDHAQPHVDFQKQQNLQLQTAAEKLPGMDEAKKAHDYSFLDLTEQIKDFYSGTIKKFSRMANEISGGRLFEDRALPAFSKELTANGVPLKADGSVQEGFDQKHLPQYVKDLLGEYNRRRGAIAQNGVSKEGFGKMGGSVPEIPSHSTPPQYEASMSSKRDANLPGYGGDIDMVPRSPTQSQPGSYDRNYPGMSQAAENMPPTPAGGISQGQTFGQMEGGLDWIEARAYNKGTRGTPEEAMFRRLYTAATEDRDRIAKEVFEGAGKKGEAEALRQARDLFHQQIDPINTIQQALRENPVQAGKILLDPAKPELAAKVLAIAGKEDQMILKGQYLDNMMEDHMLKPTLTSNSSFTSASGIQKAWDKAKKESRFFNNIFSKSEQYQVESFLNVAKAIEQRQVKIQDISTNPLVKKMEHLLLAPKHGLLRSAFKLQRAVLGNQKYLVDFLQDKVYQRYPLTAGQYQGNAQVYKQAGKGLKTAQPYAPGFVHTMKTITDQSGSNE